VRQAAWVLACSVGFACGDDASSDGPAARDGGTRDAEAEAGKGGGSAGRPGTAGAGGKSTDKPTKSVTITFRGTVAERDFSCLERYEDVGSSKTAAVPGDFRFFVQDLKLIDQAGKEVPVVLDTRAPWQTPDVALIDFEDAQGRCHGTRETNTTITGTVPEGEYKGVVFTNGVPEALNHLDQSTQPAPLDVTDLYWAWLSGYRFVVAELVRDDAAAPEAEEDAGVAPSGIGIMHIGSTRCRKDMGCSKKNRNVIRLESFDPSSDEIVADIGAIFANTDVAQDMQCHAANEICAPMFERMGVDFETGDSSDTQKVYRVAPAQVDQ
jgi:uncharacterized repeat protein (TIGR04052 family)